MFVIPAPSTKFSFWQVAILIFLNALSFFSCIFIIILTYVVPNRHRLYHHIAQNLAISDMLLSVGYILGPGQNGAACVVQASFMAIFNQCSLNWSVCMSHTVFSIVVRHQPVSRLNCWHYGICWGLGIGFQLIPLFLGSIKLIDVVSSTSGDPNNSFCWYDEITGPLTFLFFHLPCWLGAFIIFVQFAVSSYTMWTSNIEGRLWRYFLYPVVFLGTLFFAYIRPFLYGLYLASAIGFLNAATFLYIEGEVRNEVYLFVTSMLYGIQPQIDPINSSDEIDEVFRVHTPPTSSVVIDNRSQLENIAVE